MKKILLVVLSFCLCSFVSYSQFNKGSLLLGGDIGFGTQKTTSGLSEYKSNNFYFSPTIAVATKENKFWGGFLGAGFQNSESGIPSSPQWNKSYSAGVFCKKYKPVTGKLYVFIQGGVTAIYNRYKSWNGSNSYSESKGLNTGLNITPGISIAVSKKVLLESGFRNVASVNYSISKTTNYNVSNSTDNKSRGFSFSSSLGSFSDNLFFGFRFMLNKI